MDSTNEELDQREVEGWFAAPHCTRSWVQKLATNEGLRGLEMEQELCVCGASGCSCLRGAAPLAMRGGKPFRHGKGLGSASISTHKYVFRIF